MCDWPWMVQRACLIAYGPVLAALYQRDANYVSRIFRGAQPGDLPIQQPTSFGLAINLKTAKPLGIELPHLLIDRAYQVIK